MRRAIGSLTLAILIASAGAAQAQTDRRPGVEAGFRLRAVGPIHFDGMPANLTTPDGRPYALFVVNNSLGAELGVEAHGDAAIGVAEAVMQAAQQLEAVLAGAPAHFGIAAVALVGHQVRRHGGARRDDAHLLQQGVRETHCHHAEREQQQQAVLGSPPESHAAIVCGITAAALPGEPRPRGQDVRFNRYCAGLPRCR